MPSVLTVVMAGGQGERLQPLTRERAKPAVPFGGAYRIIDFTLANCLHSRLRQVVVLTQYKSLSLQRHLQHVWGDWHRCRGEYVDVLPPQQRLGRRWYEGTADAVFQNLYTIERSDADLVLVLSGDHIYRMDYQPLIAAHLEKHADVTVACVPIPLAEATQFGVMQIDADGRVIQFKEKQPATRGLPHDPARCLGSMGVYVFGRKFLCHVLHDDAQDRHSQHDFGRNILPKLIHEAEVFAYSFQDPVTKESGYWRDVGTLESYYDANMELISARPAIDLYDRRWCIPRCMSSLPPPLVRDTGGIQGLPSTLIRNALIGAGCVVTDAEIEHSILAEGVSVERDARVADSLLFEDASVGAGACLRRVIVEKRVRIPAGVTIGLDHEKDRARGLTVTASGVVVVPKEHLFEEPASSPAFIAKPTSTTRHAVLTG